LHSLSADLGDEVVVAVVMQECDLLPLCYRRDEQAGKADCPDPAAAPQRGLNLQRTPPVLIMGRQPLVTFGPVGSDQVKLSSAA
jgi:hypothetical protein